MTEGIPFLLEDPLVEDPPRIFGDVRYCVEGNADPKIIKLLDNGGAKRSSFAGISTTHMIAGAGANKVKLAEAEEVFDAAVVQQRWVAFSAKLGMLLPTDGFDGLTKLFTGLRVSSSGIKGKDLDALWANVTFLGGHFQSNMTTLTTHLVTNETVSLKYTQAQKHGIKTVCCDWVTDCIKANSIVNEVKYHPQLLFQPEGKVALAQPPGVPGDPQHIPGQSQQQPILPQQGVHQASQCLGGDKKLGIETQQGSPSLVSQPTPSPLFQAGSPQPQQIPGKPTIPNQQEMLLQNQLLAQQQTEASHQSPGQSGECSRQEIPGTFQQQILGSPTQSDTQFPPRTPDAEQRSPGQVWNVGDPPGNVVTLDSPGPQNAAAPDVEVVNSKTMTDLANLLNQNLLWNSTEIDSTTSTSTSAMVTPSTSTAFFGYEPSFKVPVNGFLIGCVFWAAQPMDGNTWSRDVLAHGGETTAEYNATTVTHVLCNNQEFPEFQQVSRVATDGKRLVTLEWLSDTCSRMLMAPPFYAMHLPTSFDGDSLPLEGLAFSVTGFDGEDRERVIKMLKLLGAQVTPFLSVLNTGLVACRAEGEKFVKAREWELPVVNIQFLNELVLSNSLCLEMIYSPKYQNFTLEEPFRLDINIAPHLMDAWKTPIRVSNDIVENFRTAKRPLETEDDLERAKRIKLMDAEKMEISYLTDKVAGADVVNAQENNLENKPPPVIMFTGFTEKFKNMATEKIISLGGRVTNEIKETTHFVTTEICTPKLYAALCRVKFIVGAPWIRDSINADRFVDETSYICKVEAFEKFHKVTVAEVLKKPDRDLLFKGMTFFITPGIVGQTRNDLETMIESAGGQSDKLQRSMENAVSEMRENYRKYIIIIDRNDFDFFEDLFTPTSFMPQCILTSKFIFTSIADQKLDF